MVKIIERVQAHYESREMPFGKTYEWHPAYLVLEKRTAPRRGGALLAG
jgi:hypothetical protein